MTRAEHLEWAKRRAHEYADAGDVPNAIASMTSDLGKHDQLRNSVAIGVIAAMGVTTVPQVKHWIDGFN